MASKFSFLEATVIRRSTVNLKKESPIPDARIEEIVKHSILHVPSPFHVQSARAVILLHNHHEKLWDMVYEHSSRTAPPEMFNTRLEPNLKAYKASYATVSRLQTALILPNRHADFHTRSSSTMTPKLSTACHQC